MGKPTAGRRSTVWLAAAAALLWLGWMIGGMLAAPMAEAARGHAAIAAWLFVLSTAIAVVVPIFSNLPLVPTAVLLWGAGWTAAALSLGWTIGSALAFGLGRLVRHGWLADQAWLRTNADMDRWIHPRHRLASLILLRMCFPLDVLSFALGLFSERTTWWQVTVSTVVGAAPFALLFAFVPSLSMLAQAVLMAVFALAFVAYAAWVRQAVTKA